MSIDHATRLWIRNEGDERAARNGCRFDVLSGAYAVWWIERYCKLYEGEGYAGTPVIMHGCHDCDHSDFYAIDSEWDDEDTQELHIERARLFSECVANGHHVDWQYESHMRIYGWLKFRAKWKRECRRFRQGSIWIPKKQKKSPTLAANGMYLLCGDGEPGQKVFLAAKDGDQARKNAAKHTIEMWLQSDVLQEECTLNRSTLQLTHEPSRSVMYPLSSSNARTQESKEGLNGSILIDETHVVDRAFVDRISRAGISRPEPLFLEFSTAGNNPDGYGKERFDYCKDVLEGKLHDEELFSIIYEAPQDISDQQLDEDFDRIAAKANPSMGHTIDPEEIRADYERSKAKIENLANFKMYRLNVWQHSSNPWIKPSDWAHCGGEFTEADLLGKTCYGGLDLSLKWDTTAFVLLFPKEDGAEDTPSYRLWVYFFLPEISARDSGSKVSWYDWQKSNYLKITEGNTTDFKAVRNCIRAARDKFDLQTVGYDDKFAEHFAQDLQDEDGINVIEFGQTPGNFAEPMGLFEGDVLAGRIEHPRNRCLDWQAGNATKNQRNGMLMKPDGEVTKKIDGIVAAVMARWMMAIKTEDNVWTPECGV